MWLIHVLGCSCEPELPNPPPDADTEEPPETDSVDTGPEPPCDYPEVEPNDAAGLGLALGLGHEGCGWLDPAADLDEWRLTLPQDDWLSIKVNAQLLGSLADVRLLVEGVGGAVLQRDDGATNDPTLVFPAVAGAWTLRLVDENLQGGDRYFYTVRPDIAKSPVEWTDEEIEPNDLPATASLVIDGTIVFGVLDTFDIDTFRFVVPGLPGEPVRAEFTVVGYALGSPADAAMTLYDSGLSVLEESSIGVSAADRDPILVASLSGGDTVYLSVTEQFGQGGSAYWYQLTVEVP